MRTCKYVSLVLAFAGIFAGCGKPDEPVVKKEYAPLLPEKTAIVAFGNVGQSYSDAGIKALIGKFNAVCKTYSDDNCEKLFEAYPELKDTDLPKILNMSNDEAFEYFWGIPMSSLKWQLFTLVPCVVTDGKTFFQCPDFAAVYCCDQALDFEKGCEKSKGYICSVLKALAVEAGVGSEELEEVFAEFKKYVAFSEGLYNGKKAVRIAFTAAAMEKLDGKTIRRFSPIATTICDDRLFVVASSEEHLAEIEKMYNGQLPAAPAGGKLARELDVPSANLFRVSMPGVLDTVKAFMAEEDYALFSANVLDDENTGKFVKALDTVRYDINADTAAEALALSLEAVFTDAAVASELKAQIEPVLMLGKGMIGMAQQEDKNMAALIPIVNAVELNIDGAKLGFSAKFPVDAFAEMLKLATEMAAESDCDDADADCGVFPDEDEIDDVDADDEEDVAE